ncbi:hypothetical protein H257_09497 [Aphanomyces astaci]|uniref:Uncharacterized protein n=1 Tax=Aphanomyces astaci TaxID=112090 RepID=W4GB16_APHAT|nr:hypothetical protein H257_09497 [Aphanomyces astaci]ETV76481.1 hypothetical protein H257_09497 [Aphanomyces astaci]KAF0752687.1 hypothetical protein AaE_005949 [Aphanomyces astaci]RHY23257.1 hypothetical protein DYB36_002118 [Aphanomyces astaci]RHY24497.1 hypothetical protein DYB25_013813 [Aphanomyces astaci]RHY68482.1 hypothetical protein DYB38_007425 [Aphanomyces astaci]|eukprot:XP_009834026.1 hypothetical protein H257_09497 [Aphanomyces astaci]
MAVTLPYAQSREDTTTMLDLIEPRVHDLLGLIQRHVELMVTANSPPQLRDWLVVALDLLARLQSTQVHQARYKQVATEMQDLEAEIVNAVLALHRHNFLPNVSTIGYVQ